MTGVLPATRWAVAGDVKNRSRRFFMTGVLPATRWAVAGDVKNRSRLFYDGRPARHPMGRRGRR
ncbi:hypothetical protein QP582_15375, partial [Raoultella ornithinolytica]|nr:hypothetical protein [Raoultella ornithinolytica]MDK7662513.1 hypothetical protein [Raoultella ornithinolytica]